MSGGPHAANDSGKSMSSAQQFVNYATQPEFLSTRYVDHATLPKWGPGLGWDCSSFTSHVMQQYGVQLPAYSDTQFKMGAPVDKANLQPGDLVFFHTDPAKVTGHVGIYIGHGKMVNAANPSAGTQIQNVTWSSYVGARRYVNISGTTTPPSSTAGVGSDQSFAGDSMTANPNGSAASVGNVNYDTLDKDQLAKQYGYAFNIIHSNKDLWNLWQQATAGGGNWSPERFQAKLRATPWYTQNAESARLAFVSETAGGKDWTDQLKAATDAVSKRATDLGFKIAPADINKFARDYIYNGWGTSAARATELDKALGGATVDGVQAAKTGAHSFQTGLSGGGEAATTAQVLRKLADDNGIAYDPNWFESAARSVAQGLTTLEEWQSDVRTKAAGQFPVFADKILAGHNARDLASPWVNRMANILELDSSQIDIHDPLLKQAMGGVDAKGQPIATGLWDFEKTLKRDNRYQYTKGANDSVDHLVSKIGSMMGMEG